MTGLYVHIPFCRHKCLYCDFPSYGGLEQWLEPYTEALCREISNAPQTGEADTVYIGGGTPSLLTPNQLGRILAAVRQKFTLTPGAEITMEANPDSLDAAYAAALPALGINRVSLGVQSFEDGLLQRLGRLHTAAQARKAVMALQQAGIRNISLDLMYGLPGQTVEDVDRDVQEFLKLSVCHGSIYSLILEEHTMLWAGVEQGKIVLPPEEEADAMGQAVHAAMEKGGFERYEISSYCRPGYASRHNSKYWQYEPYIGFGVSAHSFDRQKRWVNIANIPEYIRKAGEASVRAEEVQLSRSRAVEDYCFLALRMKAGLDYSQFQQLFNTTVEAEFGPVLEKLFIKGFLEKTPNGCRLSTQGLDYGNYVFASFIRE